MRKLLATVLFVPCIAHAEFFSGNLLLSRMNSTETVDRVIALGYVMGVFDALAGAIHCAPAGPEITSGQIRDMVKAWIEQNPGQRHRMADRIIGDVLKQAWPCANSGRRL